MNIHQNEFKYDVAFSFLFKDEKLVHELNDLINSQVKSFIYSKQQEELIGTDGIGAIKAYNDLMFGISSHDKNKREQIRKLLLQYCELDTMAMVIIWRYWMDKCNK